MDWTYTFVDVCTLLIYGKVISIFLIVFAYSKIITFTETKLTASVGKKKNKSWFQFIEISIFFKKFPVINVMSF